MEDGIGPSMEQCDGCDGSMDGDETLSFHSMIINDVH